MNLSPVARLKKTWSKVKTAKFDVLEVGTPALSCVGPRRGGLPIPLCPLAEDLLPPGGRNPVLFLALGTSVRMGIT